MLKAATPQGESFGNVELLQAGEERSLAFRQRREIERLHRRLSERDSESMLHRALMDQVPDYLWIKDASGRFVAGNRAVSEDFGLASPAELVGKTDFDVHEKGRAQAFFDAEQEIIRTGRPMIDREEYVLDGSRRGKWLLSTKMPVRDEKGDIVAIVGIGRDITERKRADEVKLEMSQILELIAKKASLRQVLEALAGTIESQISGVAIAVSLIDSQTQTLRQAASYALPAPLDGALDNASLAPGQDGAPGLVFPDKRPLARNVLIDRLWSQARASGAELGYAHCWLVPVFSHSRQLMGVLSVYSNDPSGPDEHEILVLQAVARVAGIAVERQADEDHIQFLAHHDPLTALPNRLLLTDRLSQAILRAERDFRSVTVAFIDLDNFKTINDRLGHERGDEVIRIVGERLKNCVRASDTVGRLGGDEFVIVLPDQPNDTRTNSALLHKKVQAAIAEPLAIGGGEFELTCSIGFSSFPADGPDAATLLKHADEAMYAAKKLGRDNAQHYAETVTGEGAERRSLLDELRAAIGTEQFSLAWRPEIDARVGAIVGAQARLRWSHPTLGLLKPRRFLELAEESGLAVPLSEWVVKAACRQAIAWTESHLAPVRVAVHVSPRAMRDRRWVEIVVAALRETGLPPERLELEIGESALADEDATVLARLRELQAMGVALAIDDFGAGPVNLRALAGCPLRCVKLDASLVRSIARDETDRGMAGAAVALAHKMGLRVVAQGVESAEQMRLLRDAECDEMQGAYFSGPIAADLMGRLLALNARPAMDVSAAG